MSAKLIQVVTKNYEKLLTDPKFHDVVIKVGEEPNVRAFHVHSLILATQSPYFATALSNVWVKRDENNIINFNKPNISPRVFEFIIKYIYCGSVNLADYGIPTILDVLVAADELVLEDLIDYLQTYLIEQHSDGLKENFASLYQIVFEHDSFTQLQDFCVTFAASKPEAIFKSTDFHSLKKSLLLSILKRDDLIMDEVELFEHVIQWGIAQISLPKDLKQWQDEHFETLQNTLRECLLLIRFYHISSVDFYHKVKPFARILPDNLYEDLLHHYLVPGSHKNDAEAEQIRGTGARSDSELLNSRDISQIDSWILGNQGMPNFFGLHEYKLLLRGSRDGFTPSDFHRLCDNKGPTLTVIKVKGTGELIGGYTPSSWRSSGKWSYFGGNFLFSLQNESGNHVLSKQKSDNTGVYYASSYGIVFGSSGYYDLSLYGTNFQTSSGCSSRQSGYQLPILNGAENGRVFFSVEEYEVFQVVKKQE